mmetsp:Transcript_118944/g.337228  ORF Transcript_118944/g.337228 Transcript_118944/m.337228 type:complete len:229 (-) Transcript_118944:450-1136(-)
MSLHEALQHGRVCFEPTRNSSWVHPSALRHSVCVASSIFCSSLNLCTRHSSSSLMTPSERTPSSTLRYAAFGSLFRAEYECSSLDTSPFFPSALCATRPSLPMTLRDSLRSMTVPIFLSSLDSARRSLHSHRTTRDLSSTTTVTFASAWSSSVFRYWMSPTKSLALRRPRGSPLMERVEEPSVIREMRWTGLPCSTIAAPGQSVDHSAFRMSLANSTIERPDWPKAWL